MRAGRRMSIFDPKDRVALYVHLRSFESDFDKSQSQVRAISSAWTAAVLAAAALLITTAATPVALPSHGSLLPGGLIDVRSESLAYLRTVVCVVGSGGVLAFWYIDQGLYQRLLHSVFAYGLFIESREKDLPQVRSAMYLANLDVTNRLGWFYRSQFWLFVLVSAGATSVSHIVGQEVACGVWILVGIHAGLVLACDLLVRRKWSSLGKIIEETYPDLAKELPTLELALIEPRNGIWRPDEKRKRAALLDRIQHKGYQAVAAACAGADAGSGP